MSVTPRDLARTMLERERVELAAHAARAQGLRRRLTELLTQVRTRPSRAWLIGSLAWGGFGERSDVDLVTEGLSEAEAAQLWAELVDGLHESVDVLRVETLPESFRARVLSDGVPLE